MITTLGEDLQQFHSFDGININFTLVFFFFFVVESSIPLSLVFLN